MLKIIPKVCKAKQRVWGGGEVYSVGSVGAVNQREVISFALQITEEKGLLAICSNIHSFRRVGVLCKMEGKIGWEIC